MSLWGREGTGTQATIRKGLHGVVGRMRMHRGGGGVGEAIRREGGRRIVW